MTLDPILDRSSGDVVTVLFSGGQMLMAILAILGIGVVIGRTWPKGDAGRLLLAFTGAVVLIAAWQLANWIR